MIQATNTEHLEPLSTTASITTGWGKVTAYAGDDYITDGHNLIVTSKIPANDRKRLADRAQQPWPLKVHRPNQEQVATVVTQALAQATLPVEFLGVAGGQAFLLVGTPDVDAPSLPTKRAQVLVCVRRLAYLVKLTSADRLTATSRAFLLWHGDYFVGLIART